MHLTTTLGGDTQPSMLHMGMMTMVVVVVLVVVVLVVVVVVMMAAAAGLQKSMIIDAALHPICTPTLPHSAQQSRRLAPLRQHLLLSYAASVRRVATTTKRYLTTTTAFSASLHLLRRRPTLSPASLSCTS
jgi:hypothetical protein